MKKTRKLHTKVLDPKYNEYHEKVLKDMSDPAKVNKQLMDDFISRCKDMMSRELKAGK